MTTWVVRGLLALSLCISAFAQGTTSRLLGVVQDATGAAVPAAKITLTNEGTGGTFTIQSAENGAYVFEALQPGSYTVTAEASGFAKLVARANQVTIGQPTTLNLKLEIGQTTQSVEVSGVAEVVQTSTSGNFGNLISGQEIRDMPIVGTRGRNPVNLVFLQPGVVSASNTGGGSHTFGARDRAWNYTLDGIDVNETSTGGSETTPTKMNPDSLAEFRVLTTNATADSGRNSGAQVAMVTRSGSNELHGSGFWFYRTPSLNANEWQNNLDAIGKRQFQQNIYGGSIGGPIVKNKTFFFFNGQGLHALNTTPITRLVYTAEARKGNLRYVKGGRNGAAGTGNASVDLAGNPVAGLNIGTYNVVANDPQRIGLDPTTQAAIAQTPLPNKFDYASGDGLNTAGYIFNAAQREDQHDLTFKVDQIINSKNTVYARIYFGEQDTHCDTANGGTEVFPGAPCLVDTKRSPRNLAFNWRWNPKPSVTNELVVGQNKFGYKFIQPSSLDKITLNGPVDTLAQYYFGNQRFLDTWQIVDNLAWFKGSHALKFGTNFRLQRSHDIRSSVGGLNPNQDVNFSTSINTVDPTTFGLPSDLNTSFDRPTFQSHINFLLGRVGTTTRGFVAEGDKYVPDVVDFNSHWNEYDFYVQDTWKVRKNLTIDLGLRWEIKMAPTSPDHTLSHPDLPVSAGAANSTTLKWVPGSLINDAWKNFGPSIGFAWDPFGNGKTSIRSNYRIAYDRLNTFLLASQIFSTIPGISIGVTNTDYGQSGGRLANLPKLQAPNVSPSASAQPPAFSSNANAVMDPSFKIPTTHQWAFGIQREILKNTVIEASYIGRRAYHLLGAYNVNQAEIFRNGFLDGFKIIKAGGQSDVINKMFSADSRIAAGQTASDMIRAQYASNLNLNSVAAIASSLGTRLQSGRSVSDLSGAGPFAVIKYPQFSGGLSVIDSNDFSTYHGMILQFQRRSYHGFGLQFSYTLAKALDTRSYDPTFTVVSTGALQSAGSSPFDMYNRKLNYGTADYDLRSVFQWNGTYELPFGKGKRFGNTNSSVLSRVIGGWELSGFGRWSSGRPFTVYSGSNSFSSVVQSPANCNQCTHGTGQAFDDPATGLKWFFDGGIRSLFPGAPGQPSNVANVAPGQLGNTGRNFFRTPRYFDLDAAFIKRTKITERFNLELRADATNITNTPSFDNPTATVTSSTFGRIRNSLTTASRKFQIGTKLNF